MKNAINYFYNLYPDNIRQNQEEYFFEVGAKKYIFELCNRSNEEIYELFSLVSFLYQKGLYFHQIITNNKNEFITIINSKRYILLQVFVDENRKIDINDLINLSNIKIYNNYNYIKRNNWIELWSRKIDYIEYQINENKNKYIEFSSNIDYFIGLVENAIQLLEHARNDELYISHIRINSNMKIKDLYNPLNIVLDNRTRDICEYFKDGLLKRKNILEEIFQFLQNNDLYIGDIYLFFVRFLYVTRYFDLFDNLLLEKNNEKIENEITIIVNEIKNYEEVIKKIYLYLYQKQILPEIEWIKKQAFNLF